jgi:hypothetical protein
MLSEAGEWEWEWGFLLAEPRRYNVSWKWNGKVGGGLEGRGLTLHCGGAALDPEEHGHDGVGNAVVEHVALPLELYLSAGPVAHRDAAHDKVGGDNLIDGEFFVRVLFHLAVTVGVLEARLGLGQLLDAAKGALETPLDQVNASCAELESLLAGDCGGCETGVFS